MRDWWGLDFLNALSKRPLEYGSDCSYWDNDLKKDVYGKFEFEFKNKDEKTYAMLSEPHTHWNYTDKKKYFAVPLEKLNVR